MKLTEEKVFIAIILVAWMFTVLMMHGHSQQISDKIKADLEYHNQVEVQRVNK